jgi:hypothetical protein
LKGFNYIVQRVLTKPAQWLLPDSALDAEGTILTASNYQRNGYGKWQNHVSFSSPHVDKGNDNNNKNACW